MPTTDCDFILQWALVLPAGFRTVQEAVQRKKGTGINAMRSLPVDVSSSRSKRVLYSNAKAPIVGQETIREAAFAPIVL